MSPADKTRGATSSLLAANTLAKALARACVQEKVSTSEYDNKSAAVIDALVEEYRLTYPALTRQMVTDGIARHETGKTGEEDDEDYELKVGRIMGIVDDDMERYHEKVKALRKRRESGEPELFAPSPPKRRKCGPRKSSSPKRPMKKNTPETRFVNEVYVRYCEQREKRDRLPKGMFESIVEQVKQDLGEDVDVPLANLRKRVTWHWINRDKSNEVVSEEKKETREFIEQIYQRYSRAKEHNGGKLPPGTLESIMASCKLEFGMADAKMNWKTIESKIRTRFTKEHPEFAVPGVREIGKLSDGDKRRRQILLNEITARYVRLKESGPKKLPDGSLDDIIKETKQDLGIHEFEVPKASIRGRINRKSLQVLTLGDTSPHDAIDEPLVETINNMLSTGTSVTRSQGLEIANTLLQGKNLGTDADGETIFLDAKWWRAFLERNKHRIACQNNEEGK